MKLKFSREMPEHKEEIKLTKNYLRWQEVLGDRHQNKEDVITYCSDMEIEENVRYSINDVLIERTTALFTNITWVCINDILYIG